MTLPADTAARIADVRTRVAAAANDLYEIDRDTLDVQGGIALAGAGIDLRNAEHALARLIGERPTREYRNESET